MSRTRLFAQLKSAIHRTRASENPKLLSRREFLKTSAYAGLAAAAVSRLPFATALPADPVLILGAGAGGLAAAWELQKAGIPFRIFEGSSRVGGRIFTVNDFTAEGQFIELGGELVDSDHKALLRIAQEVGAPLERLDGETHLTQVIYSLNGHIYTDKDLDLHLPMLVRAVDEARKQGAGNVTYKDGLAGNAAALRWDRMSLQEFLESLNGRVAGWLLKMVAIGYMGEFGRTASEISMLALVNLIAGVDGGIYGPSDECLRFSGGNSQLIEKLKSKLVSRSPGCLELGTQVIGLFDRGAKVEVVLKSAGSSFSVTSPRVICALPFSTLRLVDGVDRLALSPQKRACIAKLGYGTNSKTMLEFKSKPWRHGRGKLPAYNGSLTGDFASQDFWETTRKQKGTRGILTCFQGGPAGAAASPLQVPSVILPDLEKFHAGITGEYVKSAVQNWSQVPTVFGSYACLLAGQFGEINGAQAESELGGRLLFAGEHCSDESQGYMNGAVETGVVAAQEIIKKMASAPAV